MIRDPKEIAVQKGVEDITKALVKSLSPILAKALGEAFDAGSNEYAAALQRAMGTVGVPTLVPQPQTVVSRAFAPLGPPGKDGRAPRGAVRQAVSRYLLLQKQPVPTNALNAGARQVVPGISIGGIANEVARNPDLYVYENGGWNLVPAYRAKLEAELNPEKDEATEP